MPIVKTEQVYNNLKDLVLAAAPFGTWGDGSANRIFVSETAEFQPTVDKWLQFRPIGTEPMAEMAGHGLARENFEVVVGVRVLLDPDQRSTQAIANEEKGLFWLASAARAALVQGFAKSWMTGPVVYRGGGGVDRDEDEEYKWLRHTDSFSVLVELPWP